MRIHIGVREVLTLPGVIIYDFCLATLQQYGSGPPFVECYIRADSKISKQLLFIRGVRSRRRNSSHSSSKVPMRRLVKEAKVRMY